MIVQYRIPSWSELASRMGSESSSWLRLNMSIYHCFQDAKLFFFSSGDTPPKRSLLHLPHSYWHARRWVRRTNQRCSLPNMVHSCQEPDIFRSNSRFAFSAAAAKEKWFFLTTLCTANRNTKRTEGARPPRSYSPHHKKRNTTGHTSG